ncbi:MAG: pilus assembly protein N-terminal domain-containing protein [Polyangiaceae bacterium]|nr:pilus assembly protein N-terminal domain-containing protein [Polyangiaceae bacterium]MBK8996639.1 pilus assembly protein N-terminal domain-containing protein [Myxococcales bacterium]MCL4754866.1 pilus assembly protein N-terminal domain-containing protein [Myxococcales bacterium]
MKRIALLVAASLMSFAAPALAQEEAGEPAAAGEGQNELNMVVGENKTINATGVKNYSEGVKGIVDVKLTTDNTKFVVAGRKPGTTTLLLINKDDSTTTWVINVFSRSPDAVRRELSQLLGEMPGVRVRRVGSRFFIEGGVASEGDVKRIEKIAALYPGQVESLVVAGGGGAVGDRKVNIRLDFFFIRYDKTSGYAVGVDWPSRIGGPDVVQSEFRYDFLAGTTTTAEASVVNQPLPALDVASRRGWAKVLKQSTVITVNGTKATWESGGEQNFPIASGLAANIKEITFGTKVDVLPRLDEQTGELEVQVEADVSDLTPPVESTNLPGRNISKLKTLVRLKLGQSLVLSGIRTSNRRHDIRGLPILSEIPVIGVLFGSHRDSAEDVEGALFIIPTAVESVPKPAIEIVNGALSQFEEYSGDIEAVNAYNKRPQQWRKVNK